MRTHRQKCELCTINKINKKTTKQWRSQEKCILEVQNNNQSWNKAKQIGHDIFIIHSQMITWESTEHESDKACEIIQVLVYRIFTINWSISTEERKESELKRNREISRRETKTYNRGSCTYRLGVFFMWFSFSLIGLVMDESTAKYTCNILPL